MSQFSSNFLTTVLILLLRSLTTSPVSAQVIVYSIAAQCNTYNYAGDCQRYPRTCQWSVTINGCVPIPCELLDQQTCVDKRDGLQCTWSNDKGVCVYLGGGPGASYINGNIPATAAVLDVPVPVAPPVITSVAAAVAPAAVAPVISPRSDLLAMPGALSSLAASVASLNDAAPVAPVPTAAVSASSIASTIYSGCWLFRSQVECLVNTLSESCSWANSRCFPASLSGAATLDASLAPRLLLPGSTYAAATGATTALAAQTAVAAANPVVTVPNYGNGYSNGFSGTGNSQYSRYGYNGGSYGTGVVSYNSVSRRGRGADRSGTSGTRTGSSGGSAITSSG